MEKLPSPKTRAEAEALAETIRQETRQARDREQALRGRVKAMDASPIIGSKDLGANLNKILPPHLMPQNVGDLAGVMWPFFFTVTIDFGTNPTFDSLIKRSDDFRVDQEAAFILTGYQRTYYNKGAAGKGAPIQLTLRDLQSTRQYNDQPFPIQNIGEGGLPTKLDTPLLFAANATVRVEASSWVPEGESVETVGNGKQEITFFGLRVRDADNVKVIAQMFL